MVRRRIAPGLTFVKIVDRRTPRRIFVLRADVTNQPLTFDVTLAGDSLPARATTSAMARRGEALAAVNGDFSDRSTGRPIHPFVEDGTFVHAPVVRGTAFVVPRSESRALVARPEQTVVAEDPRGGVDVDDRPLERRRSAHRRDRRLLGRRRNALAAANRRVLDPPRAVWTRPDVRPDRTRADLRRRWARVRRREHGR